MKKPFFLEKIKSWFKNSWRNGQASDFDRKLCWRVCALMPSGADSSSPSLEARVTFLSCRLLGRGRSCPVDVRRLAHNYLNVHQEQAHTNASRWLSAIRSRGVPQAFYLPHGSYTCSVSRTLFLARSDGGDSPVSASLASTWCAKRMRAIVHPLDFDSRFFPSSFAIPCHFYFVRLHAQSNQSN